MHTDSTDLLEVVDTNNGLICYCPRALAEKQGLTVRAFAALIKDERAHTLLRIADDGTLTLPVTGPLPATQSREDVVRRHIETRMGRTPFALTYQKTVGDSKNVWTIFCGYLPHATLCRKVLEDTQYLLLDRDEVRGFCANPTALSPLLLRLQPDLTKE